MLIRSLPASVLLICLSGLSISPPASAQKMYRWVDENGKTHLSDQVPPDHSQFRRESLSDKGRVLEVTEEAKTKDQQELDARLTELKKAQDKIIAKQKSDDKVLLSTYRSVADMRSVLDKKMQALDSENKVLQNNLNQNQSQLERLLKRAANHERNGEKVPKPLLDEIDKTKQQIQTVQHDIARQLDKQKAVKAEFEADIERYQYLTQSDNTEGAQILSNQSSELLAADALGLYQCRDDSDCAKAWDVARQFVKTYSTTAIDMDNDRLIMSREPVQDNDLSLSISKMEVENQRKQLFLDIRCRASSLGKELCGGQKVRDIRSAFRSFIESGLKSG